VVIQIVAWDRNKYVVNIDSDLGQAQICGNLDNLDYHLFVPVSDQSLDYHICVPVPSQNIYCHQFVPVPSQNLDYHIFVPVPSQNLDYHICGLGTVINMW
jgi:hypothetical protein